MKKRHGAEQIVALLRQADVALGERPEGSRGLQQLGISEQTLLSLANEVRRDGSADGSSAARAAEKRMHG